MAAFHGLDQRTVNYVHTIIHRALDDAVRWGPLAHHAADAANPPKAGQKADSMKTWIAATLRAFLDESSRSGDRLHALWTLYTTMQRRRGLGLRWSGVVLYAGRVRVMRVPTQTRSKATLAVVETVSGRRPIALAPAYAVSERPYLPTWRYSYHSE